MACVLLYLQAPQHAIDTACCIDPSWQQTYRGVLAGAFCARLLAYPSGRYRVITDHVMTLFTRVNHEDESIPEFEELLGDHMTCIHPAKGEHIVLLHLPLESKHYT